jgi:hypothetical protein
MLWDVSNVMAEEKGSEGTVEAKCTVRLVLVAKTGHRHRINT